MLSAILMCNYSLSELERWMQYPCFNCLNLVHFTKFFLITLEINSLSHEFKNGNRASKDNAISEHMNAGLLMTNNGDKIILEAVHQRMVNKVPINIDLGFDGGVKLFWSKFQRLINS